VDHRRLICPHPPSPILPGGCNTSGCSLPHAPPTGCLTIIKNSIPWLMLVVPFATRNGSNEHFTKTISLPACCLQNCLGGLFFLGLTPVRNAPTRIGSGWSTNCGSTSATASRRQPTNAFLMSVPPTNARRPPARRLLALLNAYFRSVPPTNARRPSARRLLAPLKAFLTYELPSNTRRLCIANASSMRRPLVANVLPMHNRWRQPESSSCGFAVDASMPGLLARPRGDSNVRLLLPACNMSRNAALAHCKQRSSVSRRPPCKQRL
jgi:hypothetical protein